SLVWARGVCLWRVWVLSVYFAVTGLLVFFFFQAEDGIRDWSVTGVQTCALPISAGDRGHGGDLAEHLAVAALRCQGREPVRREEIGRASCRERGEIAGGGGAFKKKKQGRGQLQKW